MEKNIFGYIGQFKWKNEKTGKSGIKTLLVNQKGDVIQAFQIPELDPSKLPQLPTARILSEVTGSFDGRPTSQIVGVEFLD